MAGGIRVNDRHNRAAGFNADLEKYLGAGLAGWSVFRLGPDQIPFALVERLVALVNPLPAEDSPGLRG